MPQAFTETVKKIRDTNEPIVGIILIGIFFLVVASSILLTLGTRRVPVQYGKKTVGTSQTQRTSQFIPIKVNAAGVIPIIFASAIIVFPSQMIRMIGSSSNVLLNKFQYWLSPGQIPYIVV